MPGYSAGADLFCAAIGCVTPCFVSCVSGMANQNSSSPAPATPARSRNAAL